MGMEIERRFLVVPDRIRLRGGTRIVQAYFPVRGATGRVRVAGRRAFLTVKGPPRGIARREWEHPIPRDLAGVLLRSLCTPDRIVKTRHRVQHAGKTWEVDVFAGKNRGLVLAEVELKRADEAVRLPPWLSAEVSTDRRFTNSSLARTPFLSWPARERRLVGAAMRGADLHS
ncbi:MAG: CYTH domain-containing protein [Lentisphaerae bacterium]|nr:CYTH domain-containing protein [Lentisphaerota bacterium]